MTCWVVASRPRFPVSNDSEKKRLLRAARVRSPSPGGHWRDCVARGPPPQDQRSHRAGRADWLRRVGVAVLFPGTAGYRQAWGGSLLPHGWVRGDVRGTQGRSASASFASSHAGSRSLATLHPALRPPPGLGAEWRAVRAAGAGRNAERPSPARANFVPAPAGAGGPSTSSGPGSQPRPLQLQAEGVPKALPGWGRRLISEGTFRFFPVDLWTSFPSRGPPRPPGASLANKALAFALCCLLCAESRGMGSREAPAAQNPGPKAPGLWLHLSARPGGGGPRSPPPPCPVLLQAQWEVGVLEVSFAPSGSWETLPPLRGGGLGGAESESPVEWWRPGPRPRPPPSRAFISCFPVAQLPGGGGWPAVPWPFPGRPTALGPRTVKPAGSCFPSRTPTFSYFFRGLVLYPLRVSSCLGTQRSHRDSGTVLGIEPGLTWSRSPRSSVL